MKRFWSGAGIGGLLAVGLYMRDIWLYLSDFGSFLDELPGGLLDIGLMFGEMVMVALLMGVAFAIRRWHAPILMFALLLGWWSRSGTDHFFGWPADGFFRIVVCSMFAIA